jgi:hypothetical protein
MSSFQHLPYEILGEIAAYALEMGIQPSEMNLICRSMTEVINGTKTLWSNICISRYLRYPKALEKPLPFVEGIDHVRAFEIYIDLV